LDKKIIEKLGSDAQIALALLDRYTPHCHIMERAMNLIDSCTATVVVKNASRNASLTRKLRCSYGCKGKPLRDSPRLPAANGMASSRPKYSARYYTYSQLAFAGCPNPVRTGAQF